MMGKACVLCEWVCFKPKKYKEFYFILKGKKKPKKKKWG
jgi:hypothetical protein